MANLSAVKQARPNGNKVPAKQGSAPPDAKRRRISRPAPVNADAEEEDDYEEIPASRSLDLSSALAAGPAASAAGQDDEDDIMALMGKKAVKDATLAARAVIGKGKGKAKDSKDVVGGGSWQSMGLHPSLLRTLLYKGYKVPTPIQRAAIPSAMASPPRDLVGMARTGSGKTLAYMIPLLHRLGGKHSSRFGPRALVLCPGRELAMQILRVGKELARGYKGKGDVSHAGDAMDDGEAEGGPSSSSDMRWGLIVGGESLDEQFATIAANPDVIIATPGRLLHLIVEMSLDLRSVEYIVFDEADRLFEMGFEVQLHEILHSLPTTRQTLLFSATLPKSLVEFAKAGLVNPKLVRLDAETKISSDLKMGFLSVKPNEKEAALLCLLKDVLGIKFASEEDLAAMDEDVGHDRGEADGDARRGGPRGRGVKRKTDHKTGASSSQAIIFTATKHHVEYLTTLLRTAGYATSHIYGSLDQVARKQQMDRFREGHASLLVVTDVAARGIDIPILENVINYDFPCGSRVFVHRVGRTARAGRQGWAWSLVTNTELPYLLDLQLFLGRPLVSAKGSTGSAAEFTDSLVLGSMPRDLLDAEVEYVNTSLTEAAQNLPILKQVVRKGQAMYERSQGKASQESYRRAKIMMKDPAWGLAGSSVEASALHPKFRSIERQRPAGVEKSTDSEAQSRARAKLLAKVNKYSPAETVFEVGSRGKTAGAQLMQVRRKDMAKITRKKPAPDPEAEDQDEDMEPTLPEMDEGTDESDADEDDIASVFDVPKRKSYQDANFYMSHYQPSAASDKGYSLQDGQSFMEQARGATLDLAGDDGIAVRAQKASQLTWDRKKKKFVQGDGVGSDNKKLIRSESGARLPASFKSGRFDEWKAKKKLSLPKTGEAEGDVAQRAGYADGKRYRHNKFTAAKPLDPKSTTFEKKTYMAKKKAEKAGDAPEPGAGGKGGDRRKGGVGQARSELKSADAIRKQRQLLEKRRAKNARPSKNGKGKGKGKGKGRR